MQTIEREMQARAREDQSRKKDRGKGGMGQEPFGLGSILPQSGARRQPYHSGLHLSTKQVGSTCLSLPFPARSLVAAG